MKVTGNPDLLAPHSMRAWFLLSAWHGRSLPACEHGVYVYTKCVHVGSISYTSIRMLA